MFTFSRAGRALCGVATCALVAAGCNAQLTSQSHYGDSHTTVNVVAPSSGTYAAMDEVPVAGGELRLVESVEITIDETGETARAIAFPLKHTQIDADVAGPLAVVSVEQTFENPFEEPIEAVYVFPLGDEAAVTAYEIQIGERTVAGEIAERDEARAVYEQARADGHTAALLEQDKPNVFSQRVANIAPGETVRVRFRYAEMLDHADNQYELVVPTVVGPRYLPADGRGRRPVGSHRAGTASVAGATSVPYAGDAQAVATVGFRARIDAGVPITGVHSPSHDLDVIAGGAPGDVVREVELPAHESRPDRDIVVRYSAAGEQTLLGLLAHRDADSGYFTLLVQPKASYRTGDVTAREVVFLVDVSGSMDGAPIEQARALVRAVIGTLGDRDTFNVVAFANGTKRMAPQPIAGDARGRAEGTAWVDALRAGGGTEMERGVLDALATPPGHDRVRMVYMLSDGFVGNDSVILETARRELGHNRIFPVGVGPAPNRYLVDRLAEIGRGFPSYLTASESATDVASTLVRRTAYPYMTDIAIDWGGLDARAVTPARVPDVYAGLPLVVSGKYGAPGRGEVRVEATVAGRRVVIPLDVTLPERAERPAVAHVWARKRVRELMIGQGDNVTPEVERAVTAIGLAHHMVTEFTSFVAVDRTRVVAPGGAVRTVEQPVPAPEGVNLDAAVGGTEPAGASAGSASYDPPASSYRGGGGGGGGGSHWGGGDVDPLTLLIVMLVIPAAFAARRLRSA